MERRLGAIQVGERKITTVAFEAIRTENPECSGRSPDSADYLCQRGQVTFNSVRINEGQGFHDNGTFIAPSDGIYQFEISAIAYQNANLAMKTTRDNPESFKSFNLDDNYGREYSLRTVSKTATLKMEKGDGIYVENESSDSSSVRADAQYPLTFKGFKIN